MGQDDEINFFPWEVKHGPVMREYRPSRRSVFRIQEPEEIVKDKVYKVRNVDGSVETVTVTREPEKDEEGVWRFTAIGTDIVKDENYEFRDLDCVTFGIQADPKTRLWNHYNWIERLPSEEET